MRFSYKPLSWIGVLSWLIKTNPVRERITDMWSESIKTLSGTILPVNLTSVHFHFFAQVDEKKKTPNYTGIRSFPLAGRFSEKIFRISTIMCLPLFLNHFSILLSCHKTGLNNTSRILRRLLLVISIWSADFVYFYSCVNLRVRLIGWKKNIMCFEKKKAIR